MKTIIALILCATTNFSAIFTTYKVTPSSAVQALSGLQFNPSGGDFGMTNVVVAGPYYVNYDPPSSNGKDAVTPLYLSFGVSKGVVGADGAIHYQADLSRFQVYIVDSQNRVLIQAQPIYNTWTVKRIGNTSQYYCVGGVNYKGNPTGYVTVTFDTSLPPGRQVISGQFLYLNIN